MKPLSAQVIEIGPERLTEYDRIPSCFLVRSVLEVELMNSGLGGILLKEIPVERPYIKDYDREEKPTGWPRKFDVRNWGFFMAFEGRQPIGAAAVAYDTTGVFMLEARRDLSVLWDIRVHPDLRGGGIGKMLFTHAAAWAHERGCSQMKIETQNVNVPACRFYQHMGCELGEVHRYGYAAVPAVSHEVMLCWYLTL